MPINSPLKVLSIAHGAVRGDLGRIRYRDFVGRGDIAVDLVAPSRWREYGRSFAAEPPDARDVPVHVEPIRLPALPAVKWYAHYYPRLARVIARLEPHVIHLWEEPWSVVALQAARLRGKAALVLEVDQNILKRLPPPFEAIRRYVLKRTDVILARSPEAEQVVRACGFDGPVLPIGYGIDQDLFRPAGHPQPLTGRPLRAGYIGRFSEEKGLDELLEAIAAAQCPVELAIMGEGPTEPHLRRRIAELGLARRVSIEGWKGLAEVARLLQRLDVSVLLSRTTPAWKEQFGRTIIESQSCGVPVIGSGSGAIPDVVGSGGWIVGERDPLAVARLLERISRSPAELDEKRAAGLANVAARFTYPITAQRLEAAWREAAALRESKPHERGFALGKVGRVREAALHARADDGFRIVQVTRDLIDGGGVEMVAHELARAWSAAGIECSTIARTVGDGSSIDDRVEPVAGFVSRVPIRGGMRHVGRLLVVPIFTVAATWALRRHRDAVVLSHGDSLSGDVLVIHAVNAESLAVKRQSGSWTWLLNPLHGWVAIRDRCMIGGLRYRHFVAVSPRAALELQHHYGVPQDRITVIPNGIDLDRFGLDPVARKRIREALGIPAEQKVLLFVGHEFGRKGLAHAIDALGRLGDDVTLLVVGSDARAPYQRLYSGAPHRLVFAGERRDMPALYAAADAFVMPSQYETFALAAMEAMACGLPVFATRVGGIEDYLVDANNGYTIEPDGRDIAEKIRPALENPARLAELAQGARATAQRYGWPAIAARYGALLREVWRQKRAEAVDRPALMERRRA